MDITEVRVKLMDEPGERLKAFCSITFNQCFVVRDLKIIEGTSGPFVAMPSRKLTSHCPQCGTKNHLRASFCNQCGTRLADDRAPKDEEGRAKLYADIAHPINSYCREMIQEQVLKAYHLELDRALEPGYVSHYDDFYGEYSPTPDQSSRIDQPHSKPASHRPQSPLPQRPDQGPHTPPASLPKRSLPRPQNDDFGAGIF
ncbi:MAG: SpoVG family protein [Pirellulales bacterium]|nr:SpoVG family protein [Pirellulales bacterium]